MTDPNPPKKGKCQLCDTEYEIEKFSYDENPHFSGYERCFCPTCGYLPGFVEDKVREGLREIKIYDKEGKRSDNCQEVLMKILKGLKAFRPRGFENMRIDLLPMKNSIDWKERETVGKRITIIFSREGQRLDLENAETWLIEHFMDEIKCEYQMMKSEGRPWITTKERK